MVVALNMIDVAERKGIELDAAKAERLLGVPVVPTIAAHGRGVRELLDRAFEVLDKGQSLEPVRFSDDVEAEVAGVERLLPPGFPDRLQSPLHGRQAHRDGRPRLRRFPRRGGARA